MDSSAPFLSSDFFITISDIVLHNMRTEQEMVADLVNNTKENPLIFLQTDMIHVVVGTLIRLPYRFTLVSYSCDDKLVPYYVYPLEDEILLAHMNKLLDCQNLEKWYAKNISIVHPKLFPVPLGPKFQWYSTEFFGEPKQPILSILNEHCLTPEKNFLDQNMKSELLFFNYSVGTTEKPFYVEHTDIRKIAKEQLEENGFVMSENVPFIEYLQELSKYKFCISPPGRGIDTHRHWESLMVGTIPIILHTPLDPLFEKLPVLFVNDYSEVTKEYLEGKYAEIQNGNYDFSVLYTDYWYKQVKNE